MAAHDRIDYVFIATATLAKSLQGVIRYTYRFCELLAFLYNISIKNRHSNRLLM